MPLRTLLVAATVAAAGGALGAAGLQISSPAFPANGSIPVKYTCDGAGINPPLVFSGVPTSAKSLALIVEDPDVPKSLRPSGVFDHWIVWNLQPSSGGIAEGRGTGGLNGRGQPGYMGPCPPDREHRYFFTLYALDTTLTGTKIGNKQELQAAMAGHIVARAELVGRYERHQP